ALHEGFRTLDPDRAAQAGVDGDVDDGRLRIGGGADQVAGLGVDHGLVARVLDGVVAGAGIHAARALAHDDAVVADAAREDVADAAAADHVVAGTTLDEVGAAAGGDLVVAVA